MDLPASTTYLVVSSWNVTQVYPWKSRTQKLSEKCNCTKLWNYKKRCFVRLKNWHCCTFVKGKCGLAIVFLKDKHTECMHRHVRTDTNHEFNTILLVFASGALFSYAHFCFNQKKTGLFYSLFHILPDICLKGRDLASLFIAVPVTGTLVVKVLRMTEAIAFAKNTATTFMCLCRPWLVCIKHKHWVIMKNKPSTSTFTSGKKDVLQRYNAELIISLYLSTFYFTHQDGDKQGNEQPSLKPPLVFLHSALPTGWTWGK